MSQAETRHDFMTPQEEIDLCLACDKPKCIGECKEMTAVHRANRLRPVRQPAGRHWEYCATCGARRMEPTDAAGRRKKCRCGGEYGRAASRVPYGDGLIRLHCQACGWSTTRKRTMAGEYGECRHCGTKL